MDESADRARGDPTARLLVGQSAAGNIIVCDEGISFWGGVEPDSGRVIDAHHPNCGETLSDKIVLMPTSRGSCSGSGVLLQLALNGQAPAALVFREDEEILTLGAIVADRLFDRSVPVVRLPSDLYQRLGNYPSAKIANGVLRADDLTIELAPPSLGELKLSDEDRRVLAGGDGEAARLAMEILTLMTAAAGARELMDVTRAHIDGCILAHDANLIFAERMMESGAKVRIPTSINAISVDRDNWRSQGVPPDFGLRASRLADAYVRMGARQTFTCAPYLLSDAPKRDEAVGWSESNAVIYANSVFGARTAKHPDYLDLCIALTGRAPRTGVYLDENRAPGRVVTVAPPADHDDAFWPMLGWLVGMRCPDRIPLVTGLEGAAPSEDDLKALCAAFGTTSAAPMLHIAGHTPEADRSPPPDADKQIVTMADLADVWRQFNAGPATIDLVAIGSPHASLTECRALAQLMEGRRLNPGTRAIVTLGRDILAAAQAEGLVEALERVGVQIIPDLCWCSITEPVFPPNARTLMTNSGKYAHYAHGLTGRSVRFGSLADCAAAAITGVASVEPPRWLTCSG